MAKKVVLITGASRGIGAVTALEFAKNGYDVVVNYHKNEAKAVEIVEQIKSIGQRAVAIQADVSDISQVLEMYEKVCDFSQSIDTVVNNASICRQALFNDVSKDEEKRIFSVNIEGAFNCTRAFLPDMIRNKKGSIVNISSMYGQIGGSCEVHYSTTKAAIIGFTKSLALEVAPSNIRVNCVAPGVIDTDMNAHLSEDVLEDLRNETPLMRIGTSLEVAKAVYFLADNSLSGFITGQVLGVNGGSVTV